MLKQTNNIRFSAILKVRYFGDSIINCKITISEGDEKQSKLNTNVMSVFLLR